MPDIPWYLVIDHPSLQTSAVIAIRKLPALAREINEHARDASHTRVTGFRFGSVLIYANYPIRSRLGQS